MITGQRDFILKLSQNGSPSASCSNGLCLFFFKKSKKANILLLTDCSTHLYLNVEITEDSLRNKRCH